MCGKSHYTSRCTDFNVRQMLLFGKVIYHNDVICLATRVARIQGGSLIYGLHVHVCRYVTQYREGFLRFSIPK